MMIEYIAAEKETDDLIDEWHARLTSDLIDEWHARLPGFTPSLDKKDRNRHDWHDLIFYFLVCSVFALIMIRVILFLVLIF